ncbi:MAG: hypothetical protein ACK4N5_27035 [Myxococcales bacterium]
MPASARFDVNQLRIASPCSVSWDEMHGDDRTRFCGQCRLNVYNVLELSRAEVQQLVGAGDERVCMRLFRRLDGTVMTADCGVVQRVKDRAMLAAGVVLAAVLGIFGIVTVFGQNIRALFAASAGQMAYDPGPQAERSRSERPRKAIRTSFRSPEARQ